jgi:hypothetical protein
MRFNDLHLNAKKELNIQINEYANSIGGVNAFLQMIEDLRNEKPNALLNKTAIYHYTKGKIAWSKSIYKDTLTQLFNAMRKEDKDGDILNGLNPKVYKETMNMMRTLKPVTISIRNEDNSSGFTVDILDSREAKKTKVDLMFKIIFFYNIEFAKDALTFKA